MEVKSFPAPLYVALFVLSFVKGMKVEANLLYFSNISNIQYYNETSSNARVVFDNLRYGEALECNLCDHKIYWIELPGMIKRGNPNDPTDVETIISSDLHNPHGLAVDWISNNIYFSHIRAERHGRIEVAKCDGSHRKVLKHDLPKVGVLAVNPITGHLYYSRGFDEISRINLDGGDIASEVEVVEQRTFDDISGIAVDHSLNLLYWAVNNTNSNVLRYLNMTDWDCAYRRGTQLPVPTELYVESNPYEIAIVNSTLYWTELRAASIALTGGSIGRPGAIYTMNKNNNNITTLIKRSDLSPHDLCFFYDDLEVPTGGCADNNGGCELFCFSVPNNEGDGTRVQCGCPTGILIKEDNRSCNPFPDNYLVFTQVHSDEMNFEIDRTDIRMMSLDITGQYIDILMPIDLNETETVFIAYDQVDHRVYWTELDPPAIMSANIGNGTDRRVLINSSISHPESLAIDHFARNLYWIDSGLDRIEVVRLDNSHTRKVLFNSDLSHPQGLALDTINAYMYWTDLDSDTPRVERARMDGTERMVLPGVTGAIKQPSNVAVDPLTRETYWSDAFDGSEKIVRYDGERDSQLSIFNLRDVLGLAVHGNHIYWTDRGNIHQPLARADKRNGAHQESLLMNVGGFHGLVAVNKSADPGSNGCTHFPVSANQLCLPSGVSSHSLSCTDHFLLNPSNHCEDVPLAAFIATEDRVLQVRYTIDAGHQSWRQEQTLNISGATTLDVDVMENKIYWISMTDKHIYRQSINLTESRGLECVVCCCLSVPEDIAVDWYGRNLYWTDSELRVIEISKLDGSERSIFALIPETFGAPSVIKVDPLRGNLYWSPKSGAIVYQIRMDDLTTNSTPNISTLWKGSSLSESNWTVVNIAVTYSRSTENSDYLYWAVTNERSTKLYQKNLGDPDDVGVETEDTNRRAYDIETFGGFVYYHVKNRFDNDAILIVESNNFVSGNLGSFKDFVFLHHSLQPGIHECGVNNGDCGGKSLCLVADGVTGVCSCSTLQGQLLGNTCIAVNTFLLIATNKSINYVPVPVDGSSTTSRRLSIGPVGNIQAMAYDPANKSVLWIDNITNTIQSVAINGSAQWEYSVPSGIETFSMAYDWFGGQVFVTETSGFQIELLTLNGESLGSLLKLADNPHHLQKPREVVIDDENSYLYWTNHSANGDYGEAIYGMSLHNLNNVKTLNIGHKKIDKLVLDSPFLYWINRAREGAVEIERFNLSSTNSNPEVTVIATLANNVTALAATTINNQPNAFWFNETDKYIYRYNGITTEKYFMWKTQDAIIAILGYTRKELLLHRPCLTAMRPCSHLCLREPSAEGYIRCACPPSSDSGTSTSPANCSSHMCAPLQLSCDDGFDGCYPRAYRCDGISHCRNGADENNCSCDSIEQFTCYNSPSECIPHDQRCDGTANCEGREDEEFCCQKSMFGCYVDVSDRFDPYGGTGKLLNYQCLEMMSWCDGTHDCYDGSDEDNCPISSTSNSPSPKSGPLEGNTLIVIIVTIVVIIVMVVLLVGVCITVRWVHKKKLEYDMSQSMIRANNMSMGGYKGHSPPLRSESQSDYCSEMSGGTHTTQLGNGSNMSPSGETSFKYRTADPPPPSPDALTEIEDDDISRLSQPISEYTVPIPPCPSINYDALSGNMSFSVSQSQFPGTITSHYNNGMYNPRIGVNGRNNLPNPLLMHQQNGNAYYHPANHMPRPQHIYPHSGKNMPISNGTSKYGDQNYPPAPHYRQNVYSRKELDSVAQSETESTVSMNIDNPPDVFEENLPRPPPGRPPSPATLCSEYPGAQLSCMSPETGSTLSDSSDDR